VTEISDCGILLDLNNLYVNSRNHGYEPEKFLDNIPLERVFEIHLGGSDLREGIYVDSHGHPVGEEVWRFLEYVCQQAPVRGIVLERDQNFPLFSEIVSELCRAREILASARTRRGSRI
jgi:uncharacterized protein